MSFARDDVGSVRSLDALETKFIKSRTVEQEINTDKEISDSKAKEPEIRDVYEKKINTTDKRFDKIQEDYNSLEKQNQALAEVDSKLGKIEQLLEKSENPEVLEKSVQQSLDKIDKIVEDVVTKSGSDVFNSDETISDVKHQQSFQRLHKKGDDYHPKSEAAAVPERTEAKSDSVVEDKKSAERIQELKEKVTEKQSQIAELQKEIRQEVSSTVKLNVSENVNSFETEVLEVPDVKELKQSVIQEIKENPEQSRKMQVKSINSNLLLAMLSLRQ